MKKITYICDYCGHEEETDGNSNSLEPKVLYNLNGYDACRECMVKAGQFLKDLTDKNKKIWDKEFGKK